VSRGDLEIFWIVGGLRPPLQRPFRRPLNPFFSLTWSRRSLQRVPTRCGVCVQDNLETERLRSPRSRNRSTLPYRFRTLDSLFLWQAPPRPLTFSVHKNFWVMQQGNFCNSKVVIGFTYT